MNSYKPSKVQLSELEIRQLCLRSKDIFLQQPNLLELEAPIKICEYADEEFHGSGHAWVQGVELDPHS
ncbi:hypothetical protein RJ640_000902 [Escallonia rubra]|uniref:Serine-threonine protein phosphatase N-terminal domain-containing protein n=1 Tax=Escallonia rubra TaxID=112253 RepID=A0AA88SA80_9ASTE|nr:hypothetical protein RJ640_000902 [Escallonia rubra]